MKITYRKPEIVDLTGMDAFGVCQPGSGATGFCYMVGNTASNSCTSNGNQASLCICDGNQADFSGCL